MRAEKLLATAIHPGTPGPEALSAARKLGELVNRAGGVQQAFGFSRTPVLGTPPPPMSFNRRMELEEKLHAAEERTGELERELTAARSIIDQQKEHIETLKIAIANRPKKDGGTMSFEAFSQRAKTIMGHTHRGWINEFVQQTGVDPLAIRRAREGGAVSPDLIEGLKVLKQVIAESRSGLFSLSEVRDIRNWATTMNDMAIALEASSKFGRIVTEGQIRKLRSNLKNFTGGYTKEYGGSLPNVLKQGFARRGKFEWRHFPELERYVCEQFINGASATELAKHASKVTDFDISANQVTQRVYNNPPPKELISDPMDSGPLSWLELWFLGYHYANSKRGWLTPTLDFLGLGQLKAGKGGVVVRGQPLNVSEERVAALRAAYANRSPEKRKR